MARGKEKVRPILPAQVEKLDAEGRGVARSSEGKVIFIEGALPGESVMYEQIRNKPSYEIGRVTEVLTPADIRVTPKCPNFGIGPGSCGGCAMQHLDAKAQVEFKQTVLTDALWHIGKVTAESILPPLYGEYWNYRHRARLTVRDVAKKGGILVGFHEKSSSYVADMTECHILPQKISDMLVPMRELVNSLTIAKRLPQIEVAVDLEGHTALVLRILEPLAPEDEQKIEAFAKEWGVDMWLQPKGPETAAPMHPEALENLRLTLPAFDISIPFKPTDFTQVNPKLNVEMVTRAIDFLQVEENHKVADFFCGLGNFTLPLARKAGRVIGIEGSEGLVARARNGASRNGLTNKTEFVARNLFTWCEDDWKSLWDKMGGIDRVLIDPPREGALALSQVLAATDLRPARVVYVSCNPATLARDCAILHHEGGWHVRAAGVMNMFPHTGHVESIAILEPGPKPVKDQKSESDTAEISLEQAVTNSSNPQ
ncbi:MAG: 23S rRNA (uracil(1939)-C(5))-methyltransferase RlmD [Sutterellaceae bacterium]|nr:23S rRNA (uracil(1939)-C(5))-methyltransferase RlmD [Sutterellaceae bacterium]